MFEDFETELTADSRKRRRFCAFTQWLQALEPADQEIAKQLVAGNQYNCRQLARYFQDKGATFNDQVLMRHRNRTCCGQVS